MPLHLSAAMRNLLARFAVSNQGNVAIIFAIASIPLIAAMGLAVDYTRAAQTNSAMQDALDAASLALSRRTDLSTMTPAEIQKFAQDYFNANFHNSELQDLKLNASYTPSGPSITISANGNLPTDFMGIIGTKVVPLGRSSTTVWGEARLRVALALDNTGSMASSGKMTALKTATHNLLTQLKGAATVDGDVYVSIIPFVKDVNVGGIAGNKTYKETWVKWDGTNSPIDNDLWDKWNGTCNNAGGWSGWGGWGGWGGSSIPATTPTRPIASATATPGIRRRIRPGTVASWTATRTSTRTSTRSTRRRTSPTRRPCSRPSSTAPAQRR